MKLVHQALSAHPHSQPYPRLTRFNSHRSAAPDKAASFKSLYLNRPAEDQAAQSVRTVGGPDTALRLERSRCAADAFACAGPVVEVMI